MLAVCLALIDDEKDKVFFREIYDSLERQLFVFSVNILQNTMLAEEAVSETFLALAQNLKKVQNFETAEITAYTVIINRNLCYDILKKENRQKTTIVTDKYIESKADQSLNENFENMLVADAVEKLPEIYRDVIMLKYFYGFSVKEISRQLHLSVGGVKSRLETARKILRKELAPND